MIDIREYKIEKEELKFDYVVFENGDVINITKGYKIKPSKDKRRPHLSPLIYFKRVDGTRECIMLDRLIASLFLENYNDDSFIEHEDGDPDNCDVSNLKLYNGIDVLRQVFNDSLDWRRVSIDIDLYYDYYICEDGRLFNASTHSFVKPFKDNRPGNYGNLRYNMYINKSSKDVIKMSASRLVALHFIQNHPKNANIVLFKDRNHENLHYTNLYWGDTWDSLNQDIVNESRSRVRNSLYNSLLGYEKWKVLKLDDVEFQYTYMISNMGRVYNEDKKFYCSLLRNNENLNNQSHINVNLKVKDTGYRIFSVHRLVALLFCVNNDPTKKKHVNHINGNPECNWCINLEWCTHLENMHHAVETNLAYNTNFINHVTDTYWRLNTILAWIFSFKNMSFENGYKLYCEYKDKYIDNIPNLSLEEFIYTYNDKNESDSDFKKLKNFYSNNYK